jgi:hypothetical protein
MIEQRGQKVKYFKPVAIRHDACQGGDDICALLHAYPACPMKCAAYFIGVESAGYSTGAPTLFPDLQMDVPFSYIILDLIFFALASNFSASSSFPIFL